MNRCCLHYLSVAVLSVVVTCMVPILSAGTAWADPGQVLFHQKVSDTNGLFSGVLDDEDWFGISVAALGDLNGDGIGDMAVGANGDDDLIANSGAVWVLFLNRAGGVVSHQKISNLEGNLQGVLYQNDYFGWSVASLGDLDGAGETPLAIAVGAYNDDVTGTVRVLFLNPDGTVHHQQTISGTEGNFGGELDDNDLFGFDVTSIGDLDGDGVDDMMVGAPYDDDGGVDSDRGALWILFLNDDGTVKSHTKISDTEGGFLGTLDDEDLFGLSVCSLGDLDGPGGSALAVAVDAGLDDDGGTTSTHNAGAVWILFLNTDGTVSDYQKISATEGGFTGQLDAEDRFGGRGALAPLGDLNGDGIGDLAVGSFHDDDAIQNSGAVWLLYLNSDGTVSSHQKISNFEGNFSGLLPYEEHFGASVVSLGNLGNPLENGLTLAVGADFDDDGGLNKGAVWMLFLCDEIQVCNPVSVDPENVPPPATLLSTQPNPFRTETSFQYSLPVASPVHVRIYDVTGQLVRTVVNEPQSPGPHSASWDGRNGLGEPVVAGVYFVRLETGSGTLTSKVAKAH